MTSPVRSSRTALILGVGNAQVDLIHYLKESGWQVIGCSYRQEGRGLAAVDHFELVNVVDAEQVETLARARQIDLLYTVGSDLAMPTVARVSERLGLPSFVSAETAEMLQNKLMLRAFLSAHAISPIRHAKITTPADLDGWDIYPAILKPVDNQGQRGVYLAQDRATALAGLNTALGFSRSRTLIVEEFLSGPEVSANTFIVNGQTVLNEVSDRYVVEGYAGGLPRGHVYPARACIGDLLEETRRLVALCNRELGIQNGPVYYQIILTPHGPRIVEVTPRLDGCHMWRLIKSVTGVDLLEVCVNFLAGTPLPDMTVPAGLASQYLGFFYQPTGEIFDPARHLKGSNAMHLEYYYTAGETVRPINGYYEKVGYYIESFDS